MLYILGILTALQVVVAQTLWKIGLDRVGFVADKEFILSSQVFRVFLSPLIVLGVFLYISATFSFFVLLSMFDYSHSQTVVVCSSLTLTFLSAAVIFNEQLLLINLLGVLLIFIGVLLITRF